MREEQNIFDDLAKLCLSPGYVHALAYLCFRDNMVGYASEMKAEDMQHLFSMTRLVRTEISILMGLLIKGEVDYTLPAPEVFQEYVYKTETLLEEVHRSMSAAMFAGLGSMKVAESDFNLFTTGEALREPIFYGGESAYSFQYRDLSLRKYANDDEWLEFNKGFSIGVAREVVHAVGIVQNEKMTATARALRKTSSEEQTILPGYSFTAHDIAECAGVDISVAERVLTVFAVPEGEYNKSFCALHDFNIANASPLLRASHDTYILFHQYSLTEALYESPFYWMGADKKYESTAMSHRGRFTEEFSRERLEFVFGKDKVYSNVDVFKSKDKVGEIDVLVIFGNRAIVLQAKSKRLTLEARRGNDGRIKDDFQKSIQDSYDQGYLCASLLTDAKYKLVCKDSKEIVVPAEIKEIYIFCVVSDHYPALSFQSRQFLKTETSKIIQPPLVMDVFTLDAMTEMLESPLRLLSYVNRRTSYSDKLHCSHELTVLSYHLTQNLWLDDKYDSVTLLDDISADLDVAMSVRRDGVPGKRTPDGILTRFVGTALGRIVAEIEARPDPATIDLGFMLLTLGEDTVVDVSKGIDRIVSLAMKDCKNHDLTIGLGVGGTGLTIHCNEDPIFIAGPRLQSHCESRKYTQRADSWFGVCIRPGDASLRFGINLAYKWVQSPEMDAMTRDLPSPGKLTDLWAPGIQKRIGRNEPCPCGSGLKNKKCCLAR